MVRRKVEIAESNVYADELSCVSTTESSSLSTPIPISTEADMMVEGLQKEGKSNKVKRWEFIATSMMCATCMLINSSLSFFLVEKERLWTQGHELSLKCEIAEFGFLLSGFLSISGTYLACSNEDWLWFVPGSVTLFISSLIYLSVDTSCEV